MNNVPRVEPNADLRQMAHGLRQIFVAFTEAGFTDSEALTMTITVMNAQPGGGE